MAGFCGSCGFPLGANLAFCPQCGKKSAGSTGPAMPQQMPQQMAQQMPQAPAVALPPAAKSSGFKILMGVLVFFMVVGIGAAGMIYYAVHRVKHAIVEKAATYGVDLQPTPSTRAAIHKTGALHACDLISKQEVSALIGEPIVRTEEQERGGNCLYFAPPGRSATLAREQARLAAKRIENGDSGSDRQDGFRTVTQLVEGMTEGAGKGVLGEDPPMLMLIVDTTDGKTQMTALAASKAIFNGIGAGVRPGAEGGVGSTVPGLGDQAIRMVKLGLNVLKGDTFIRIIMSPMPDADEKSVAIARAVLPKI